MSTQKPTTWSQRVSFQIYSSFSNLVTSFRWWRCNYLKNIRRLSTFRAKTFRLEFIYSVTLILQTKGLRSKCRNCPYIFQVVASIPTNESLLLLALPTLTHTVLEPCACRYNKCMNWLHDINQYIPIFYMYSNYNRLRCNIVSSCRSLRRVVKIFDTIGTDVWCVRMRSANQRKLNNSL